MNKSKITCRETLLIYPKFDEPNEIHTGISKVQLGEEISQNNNPITFSSRQLNPAQVNYTTTERELLSVVEALKELRNMILDQQIMGFTAYKILLYKTGNTEREL